MGGAKITTESDKRMRLLTRLYGIIIINTIIITTVPLALPPHCSHVHFISYNYAIIIL